MQTELNNFLISSKDRKNYPFGYKKTRIPIESCETKIGKFKTIKIEKLQNENSIFDVFYKTISRI